MIRRYQNGARSEYLMQIIKGNIPTKTGRKSSFCLNKTAKDLLLGEELHKVSSMCCDISKKKPLKSYEKQTSKLPIIGVRGSESARRKGKYTSCLTAKKHFTPIYDFTDKMCEAVYKVFDIEIPNIYNHIDRTGCIMCPYSKKNILKEAKLATKSQVKYALDSFGESYKTKGLYEDIMRIYTAK